jgi:hypothetical protein
MPEDVVAVPGAFIASLKRNNKQIRDDRATAIAEAAQLSKSPYPELLENYA